MEFVAYLNVAMEMRSVRSRCLSGETTRQVRVQASFARQRRAYRQCGGADVKCMAKYDRGTSRRIGMGETRCAIIGIGRTTSKVAMFSKPVDDEEPPEAEDEESDGLIEDDDSGGDDGGEGGNGGGDDGGNESNGDGDKSGGPTNVIILAAMIVALALQSTVIWVHPGGRA